MLVDDNRNAAEAMCTFLNFEPMICEAVFGGREGIHLGFVWSPHIIVMDISMPECNGYEAALTLRRDPRTAEIPIIAFTALDETEVRRHLTDHEFDAYCQKGQPPRELVRLILSMVQI